MIGPQEFAQGCQLLVTEWQRWVPGAPAWRWQEASGALTASLVSSGGLGETRKMPSVQGEQLWALLGSRKHSGLPCPPLQGGGYLVMGPVPWQAAPGASGPECSSPAVDVSPGQAPELSDDDNDGEVGQPAAAAAAGTGAVHLYTHYVVYSPSFGVPVWYFEGCDQGKCEGPNVQGVRGALPLAGRPGEHAGFQHASMRF